MSLLQNMMDRLRGGLHSLFRKEQSERELDEELRGYVEAAAEAKIKAGMSRADALRAARMELGGAESVKEEVRAAGWEYAVDTLWQDLRFGARLLRKSPGFTAVAVLTLALGIGANTAIFSLLDAILLRNLPVYQPRELLFFGNAGPEGDTDFLPHGSALLFSYPFFREFREKNEVFSNVAAIGSQLYRTHGRITGSNMEKLNVELVSGSYFNTLGVNGILGRVLTEADDQTPGAHPVAVASYSWWQRRLARDPSAVGRTVTMGSTVYSIVGVAPTEFLGVTVGQSPDLWIPLAMEQQISPGKNGLLENNLFQSLHIIVRLKPGISEKQAQADTNVLFRQILRSYVGPQASTQELENIQHAQIELTPAATGRSRLRTLFSSPLKILMVVVALVLLIACANIANLLLARAAARQNEIAIRMSTGAARWRLIRQLLVESGLLGLTGAVFGVLFAWGASRLLLLMVSAGAQPVPIRITPDAEVLAFTLAVAMFTVLLFGAAPAFRATAVDLTPSLKEGRSVISTRNRLGRGLVVGQVAVSLVLLVCAGLFLRSLGNLADVDTGFDKQNALLMRVDPGAAGYQTGPRLESMMERVEERVGSLPGIRGASFALSVFNQGGFTTDTVVLPGQSPSERNRARVNHNIVGPQYFDAMKMPVVLGRALSPRDNWASPKVAVINETMARTFFPGESPLGRTFPFENGEGDDTEWQNIEVVGVVKDAKYMDLEETQMPAAFYPHAQHSKQFVDNFVVRYSGNPTSVIPEIRKAVAEVDPNLPLGDVTTLAQMVDDNVLDMRLVAQLSTIFGIVAAFLACIGIYGVMSYGIARRTKEFGIRMALGAERRNILWAVLRQTLWLVALGVAIGLAVALVSGRLVESALFGLKSNDPFALGLAILVMIVVAMFAGYLPARRATRVDPMVALRHE